MEDPGTTTGAEALGPYEYVVIAVVVDIPR
jgi:hypothetical protein